MSVALGLLLGLGLVLSLSPLLWPRPGPSERVARGRTLLHDRLVQAGLGDVRPGVLVLLSVLGAVAAATVTAALLPVPVLAGAAGVGGFLLPVVVLGWRARVRRRRARVVWPDVVEHLLSAVRAGLPLPDAVVALAESGPEPVRAAVRAVAGRIEGSGELDDALVELKARLADPVADRIVETLRMARDVGGTELPAVLRALAADLRRDAALRAEVESRQSWVRNAARLGVAAPWVVLLLLCTRPEAVKAYDSPLGAALVMGGAIVTLVAYRVMIALGRLPEERRWFA